MSPVGITPNLAICYRCQGSTGGCNGQCLGHGNEPYLGRAELPAKGCICPPTSEKTCQRWDCGRRTATLSQVAQGSGQNLADANPKKAPSP